MSVLPAWLSPRRVLLVSAMAAAATVAIVAYHTSARDGFLRQVEGALPLSAALSADALHDWVTMRVTQAEVLAQLATQVRWSDPRPDATLAHALQVMATSGGFARAYVVDGPSRPARLRARTATDSVSLVEFAAPVGDSATARQWVVLGAIASETTFSHFNVAAANDLTQRTTLLAIDGDAVSVITSSAAGGAPRTRGARVARPVISDAYRQAVLANRAGVSHGIDIGLYGRAVVYARVPVPGTPWLLVRERDVEELAQLIRPSVLISDGVFALLTLLTIGVVLMLWRSAFLRRESEAIQLRSAFVSSVSHELRTPLTQIRMYAEMLRLGLMDAPAESARALGVIEKEAERLSMLVERSLSYIRSGHVTETLVPTEINVGDAARAAVAVVTPLAAERRSTVIVDVANDVTARIDRDALHQVLLNLLDNAIKYGPDGQTIHISATREQRGTQIEVIDEGPGIPHDERELVWRAFQRGRLAQEQPQLGSGIGLAVVRDLVTRAQGRVSVEERRDGVGGARFVVELPTDTTE
jgi:signal transduction histidine kinase